MKVTIIFTQDGPRWTAWSDEMFGGDLGRGQGG